MKKVFAIVGVVAAILLFVVLVTLKLYDEGKFSVKYITTTIHEDECSKESVLRRIPVRTCNGEGELYLYETDDPFGPIATSFEIERNQLLIFTSKSAEVWVKVNGQSVVPEVLSFTDGRVRLVRSVEKGAKVCISGDYKNGIRGVQGFLAQNSTRPVYDINTFQYIYRDQASDEMFLTPGSYSYAFFDKYSLNGPGQGTDTRKLGIKIEGPDGIVVDKIYTQPAPGGTEGAVVGNYSISQQGNYMLNVDSEDSIYWALVKCPVCGDGKQEKGEDCDEGDDNGEVCVADYNDDCFYCSENCEYITEKGPYCGDDNIDQGHEECDDGSDNGEPCTPVYGGTCTYCSSSCEEETVSGSSCGDGTIDVGEECDDGNNVNGDGCTSTCEKPESCNDVCTSAIGCDGLYSCESGHCRNATCSDETDCICASCGDGDLDSGEECDDGNSINGDGCDSDCTIPDSCNDTCVDSIGCEGGFDCVGGSCRNSSCSSELDCICASCGDGDLDSGEECDDGNSINGDGCDSDCTIPDSCNDTCVDSIGCEGGFDCVGGSCRNSSCSSELDCICASCGDGDLDSGEECDDGNNKSGDGCSKSCKEEEEDSGDCDGSIGNYVWNDANGDGVQDADEKGLAKIDMKLTWAGPDDDFGDSDDEVFRDDTDSDGRYKFRGLCKGKYRVRVKDTEVAAYVQTYDPDGKNDHKTNVTLKNDHDEHTKADFGYRALKVAPASGVGLVVILLISLVVTTMVFAGYFLNRKLHFLKK